MKRIAHDEVVKKMFAPGWMATKAILTKANSFFKKNTPTVQPGSTTTPASISVASISSPTTPRQTSAQKPAQIPSTTTAQSVQTPLTSPLTPTLTPMTPADSPKFQVCNCVELVDLFFIFLFIFFGVYVCWFGILIFCVQKQTSTSISQQSTPVSTQKQPRKSLKRKTQEQKQDVMPEQKQSQTKRVKVKKQTETQEQKPQLSPLPSPSQTPLQATQKQWAAQQQKQQQFAESQMRNADLMVNVSLSLSCFTCVASIISSVFVLFCFVLFCFVLFCFVLFCFSYHIALPLNVSLV
jgi:hypothetical protein